MIQQSRSASVELVFPEPFGNRLTRSIVQIWRNEAQIQMGPVESLLTATLLKDKPKVTLAWYTGTIMSLETVHDAASPQHELSACL